MRRVAVLAVAAALAAGCGSDEPKVAPVKMTVVLDGKPMREGDIYLYAPGKPPQAFHIENGTIPGVVPVGTYRVEIALFKPDPNPKKAAAGIDITNVLPTRYSTDSTLTAEVREDSPNEFTFTIKSQ